MVTALLIAIQAALVGLIAAADPIAGIIVAGIFGILQTAIGVSLPFLLRRRRQARRDTEGDDG